ncbi:hypothetical protein AMIS_50260 [Actinoplanes missouriensis 431]|uniref:ATP synthase F0 subunit B n=1 Tax=Actinoplanes missouriensis (strain ATCC 14538 / DSM 43046 / CBS 188.64 / JCM 3121 / NBRC 102363 / NCIMB 12654 / NRRL B-3342 / UNCC 431) TaxID=512565 RepID=I0HB59_ACTM4|nr:hypothetical protein [Actinoplanes missouriensis]BAL90246.1 hypothetical protein AMIS_50260 [Actinoplanes missouriensis 431]
MSDISPGSRLPADPAYPADVPPETAATQAVPAYSAPEYETTTEYSTTTEYPATTSYPAAGSAQGSGTTGTTSESDETSKPRQVAQQARESAGQAAADVTQTAKEQAQRVGQEARAQARGVASEIRGKLDEQARTQNSRLVGSIRQTADHLDEMRGTREDSPAAAVVARVADGGRQFADYLDRNGPDGVLREVEDFARRRPGAFLATALAAGFVVGRLGKSVAKADGDAGKPSTDTFRPEYESPSTSGTAGYATPPETPTGTGYAATTEYTATGTGTPAVVRETYVEEPITPATTVPPVPPTTAQETYVPGERS